MRIQSLKTISIQRSLALLGCALPPSVFGHGWLTACSLVAALWAVKNLVQALHWKDRIQQVRTAVEERVPGADILHWEKPFAMREWGREGVIHHPFACRLVTGEVVRCNGELYREVD